MRILVLFLLVSCTSSPRLVELEERYFECTRDQAEGCDILAEEIDRIYTLRERKAFRKREAIRRRCSSGNAKCFIRK